MGPSYADAHDSPSRRPPGPTAGRETWSDFRHGLVEWGLFLRVMMGEMITEAAPVSEGEVVAGKYRLGRVLGQGGMGTVVEATHVQLHQRVALKFLRAELLGNTQVVARFTREAQAAARIQSVHVARVLDVGELPSGAPYMVIEYLDGEDLEQVLRRRGPLPIAEAVDLLLQGAEAVAEAHTLGIVHRDLKPANLFLARYPGGRQIVKVLDFGISKVQSPPDNPGLTQAAAMIGSPPYMAPEQVRSARAVDVRSDIWSLGAVLYELLTQTMPFPVESVQSLFVAILFNDPAPPRALRAEIPPALDAVVIRCLQKDPALRFQDVAALAAALGPFGSPSSADVPARIAQLIHAGATAVTTAAEDAAPAPTPAASLPGQRAIASAQTSPLSDVAAADGAATARTQAFVPVSVEAPPRQRTRSPVIALVGAGAILAAGAAYWLGTRTPRQRTATVSVAAAAPAPAPSPPPPPRAAPAAPAPPERQPPPISTPPPAPPVPGDRHHAGPGKPRDRSSPAAPGASAAAPAVCADLLARLSLGETLTPQEASTYARLCEKHQ